MKKWMIKAIAGCLGLTLAFGIGTTLPKFAAAADAPAQEVINPMAHYKFLEADGDHIGVNAVGKDYSGNGFDLKAQDTTADGTGWNLQTGDDGETYVSFKRGEGATARGGFLYAPELGAKVGKDFSDLITNSYTVSMTFKRDKLGGGGGHYGLSTGKYHDSFGIVPWYDTGEDGGIYGEIEITTDNIANKPADYEGDDQQWQLSKKTRIAYPEIDQWTTLTVTADKITKSIKIYINGKLNQEKTDVDDILFTNPNQRYTFTIGAQAEYTGNAGDGFADMSVKDVRVYDTALSAGNVARIYNNGDVKAEEAVAVVEADSDDKQIVSVAAVDTSNIDLEVTDRNTTEMLINEKLPKRVQATLSDGTEVPTTVVWYPDQTGAKTLVGYLQSTYANGKQLHAEVDYDHVIKFSYDKAMVDVTDIRLDGADYVPGTSVDTKRHTLTFRVVPKGDFVSIKRVNYDGDNWLEYVDDMTAPITVDYATDGAEIVIIASAKECTVTYYDGQEKLGTSKYSYQGSETLKTFEKEGYTFVGWFTDAACTQAFTALDYDNPTDLTLYAKYTANGGAPDDGQPDGSNETPTSGKNGCGCGSVVGSVSGLVGLVLLGAAAIVTAKRKSK